MTKINHLFYLFLLLTMIPLGWAQDSQNTPPVVSNVLAEQVDFEHLLIRYDVEDVEGDPIKVWVKPSSDRGQTFTRTVF